MIVCGSSESSCRSPAVEVEGVFEVRAEGSAIFD
jgi:hypothetical protein